MEPSDAAALGYPNPAPDFVPLMSGILQDQTQFPFHDKTDKPLTRGAKRRLLSKKKLEEKAQKRHSYVFKVIDPKNPETGRTVSLTIYQTLVLRKGLLTIKI